MTPLGQRIRLGTAVAAVLLAFAGVGRQLVDLQLGDHDRVLLRQQRARTFREELPAPRGRILDRNGQVLAIDRAVSDLAVDPAFIVENGDPRGVALLLGSLAGLDAAALHGAITGHGVGRHFLRVHRFLPDEAADAIAQAKKDNPRDLKGVILEERSARSYPLNSLMSHVVGYCSSLGQPAAGVEMRLNNRLRGRAGLRVGETDGANQELYGRRSVDVPPQPGLNVELTLDQHLQFQMEQALDRAMLEHSPDAAWAVMMDTRTGEILALASKPDFNPNLGFDYSQPYRHNHVVSTTYEPGSVVKSMVIAAAFNEGVVKPDDILDCTSPWSYGGRRLNDAHPYTGTRTVMDILKKSSNVGTAKIALMLGDERLERYYRDFGLGQRTGIDLPYEDGGIFHPRDRDCAFCGRDRQGRSRCHGWSALTPTRISIGQGIALTAIQIVGAVNTIANDGLRMQPILVRRVTTPDGSEIERNAPTVVKRVLDLESARLTARLMARITEQGGTGARAAIPGVAVAGKTGTAQKPVPGGYSHTDYVASFVGFLPAENPRFTLLVTLDNPKGRAGHQGGQVAAPVFREIAEDAIRYLDIPTNSVPRQVEI